VASDRVKADFDVVVVGSGAGGGVVASELAQRGRDVLLLELGPHLTAADFTRWEAKANHDFWWPLRLAPLEGGEMIAFLGGRCVGGTTTINTKVALRAHERDVAKWHAATGLTSDGATPFTAADLDPFYDRVEAVLGVRERRDWKKSVHTVEPGFRALGAELEPVHAYTDVNCMSCGSCLQGCPTNAGKSTMNTYIHSAWAEGLLELRPNCAVERVLIGDDGDGLRATGVEYVDEGGERVAVGARMVVVAAGALNTPQLLIRSGLGGSGHASPSTAAIGRHLGVHPVRLVYGLFDEPQDAHMVYPITAHCMEHQHDEDGGFVIEATTIQDPIAFAATLCDEDGPMWGERLVEAVRRFRYWAGVLAMANDDNASAVVVEDGGGERFDVELTPADRGRIDAGLRFSREVLEAAGATRVCWSGLASTHVQGSCRMGDDPARSVVDRNAESHDVKRLFVGDASLVPRTLSVNPSLTVMALATRLAEHLDADPSGYLGGTAAAARA
jgi:choline dehydrogenase-like flavoprotein